jgi:hypothetical protein
MRFHVYVYYVKSYNRNNTHTKDGTYPPFCLRRMDEFESRSRLNLAADTRVLVEELIDLSNDEVCSLLPLSCQK